MMFYMNKCDELRDELDDIKKEKNAILENLYEKIDGKNK